MKGFEKKIVHVWAEIPHERGGNQENSESCKKLNPYEIDVMKRKFAWIGAILSGLYLLTAGPIPDPIPFVDEGLALAMLLKCTAYLGYDLRKWLPFFSKKQNSPQSNDSSKKAAYKDVTIDV